jgi:hypothetical protein
LSKRIKRPGKADIRIGADQYRAILTTASPVFNGTAVNGKCLPDDRLLHMECHEQPLAQLQLAWHEVIHAIDSQYALHLSEDNVKRLGRAVGACLWDNLQWWVLMGLGQHEQMQVREPGKEKAPSE